MTRPQLALLGICFLAGGVLFALATPIGEGPDEPAHLAYIRHLIEQRELPSPPLRYDAENYEWHQQPLDYLVSAVLLGVLSPSGIDLTFAQNPDFDFHRAGSRAFANATGRSVTVVRALRILRLGWGLITIYAAAAILSALIPNKQALWLAYPFLLAPQFLFISAVINNDAAVTTFSTLTLLLLARFVEMPNVRRGVLVGLCVLAALFSKASAVFLIVPAMIAVVLQRDRKPAIALSASTLGALAIWLAFNSYRFGSILPPVPPAGPAASPMQLLGEPRWIGSLFRSFWAKLGWLNTPMPWPFYIWFAALSLIVLFGLAVLLRRGASMVLFTALVTNALLVMAFLLEVDLQPQGRYLFPSIAAIATFGAAGLFALSQRTNENVPGAIAIVSLVVAAAGVLTMTPFLSL